MLTIITAPNPVLSRQAKPVIKIDSAIKKLIAQMKETLINTHDPEGVGLAAPQIGKSLQIFLVKQSPSAPFITFINPQIEVSIEKKEDPSAKKKKKKETEVKLEGCLSLPNIWGEVKRDPKVTVSYMDDKGTRKTKLFSGFTAVIIQHEFDHLQGILFPKRVLEQKGSMYKSRRNEKGEDIFDEIEL